MNYYKENIARNVQAFGSQLETKINWFIYLLVVIIKKSSWNMQALGTQLKARINWLIYLLDSNNENMARNVEVSDHSWKPKYTDSYIY